MPTKSQKKEIKKVIEDRTFGLKNKNKSKTVQKFVKGVEITAKHQGMSQTKLEQEEFDRKKLKKKKEEEAALLKALYNDASNIRQNGEDSEEEEDPANTLCPYFKQGLCQKGKKCIYSHDLTIGRTEEIDLYVDQRTQLIMNAIGGKNMAEMSEDDLNKMIGQKEKEMMKGCRSNIVCKFFLEAAEKDKYGWNWNCPNGDGCKYKHCLPPGYRLLRDEKGNRKIEVEEIDIEAKIDEERNELLSQNRQSPLVTLEVFKKWKELRKLKKQAQQEKKKKEEEKKAKKGGGQLKTGLELFQYNPNLFVDDEGAADDYEKEELPEEEQQDEEIQKVEKVEGDQDEDDEDREYGEEKQPLEKVQETVEEEN